MPALQLRFRDPSPPSGLPDTADFVRAPDRPRPTAEEVGVLPSASTSAALDPDAPLVVFFQTRRDGIPAPNREARLPPLSTWSLRPTTFGWIASVPRGPVANGRPRASWVLAGCLSLALPGASIPVHAAEPAAAPPRAASSAPESVEASTSEPAPPALPEPATGELPTPPEYTPAPPPTDTAAPPVKTNTGSDTSVIDAAWEGVKGFDVVLELQSGSTKRGIVGAVQTNTFTLIENGTGKVLVLPKSGVVSLRAYIPPPVPRKNGTGLLVGGGILTAIGGPVFITGVVFVGLCPSCTYLHLPMLIVGGAATGVGIPLLVKGTRARGLQRGGPEARADAGRGAPARRRVDGRPAVSVLRGCWRGWTPGSSLERTAPRVHSRITCTGLLVASTRNVR